MAENKVLLFFIDGVGIGEPDPDKNPFFRYGFKTFEQVFGAIPSSLTSRLSAKDAVLFPVDACLGMQGYPQSGTGQTSIFCGVNASEILGEHFGPYPHSKLLPVIEKENIFSYYKNAGLKPFFANAYPKVFFEYMKKRTRFMSASTICYTSTGFKLNTSTSVHKGQSLTAEITGHRWNEKLGYKLEVLSPQAAARRLLRITGKNDFTLYEYFLTDYAGHGRIAAEMVTFHHILDEFLFTLLTERPDNVTILVISDHGNYEDVSIKSHTMNPALCIAAGKDAGKIAERIHSLPDVKKALSGVSGI